MADPSTALFKEIPEFFEVDIGESLTARTETLVSFRELGPPDLCHVVKSCGKSGVKDIGSYHYVSGVDASSSASLAAYLNSLTYAMEEPPAWFSSKGSWKVRSGCYCCFNAFSRVDVRVDVKIPGGVNAYVIDLRGERHDPTPLLWAETYLSAILRSILYTDDPSYKLIGYRKLEPITSPEGEERFLRAAEDLFTKGWQLGTSPTIQVASPSSNHLVFGLLKYFGDCNRWEPLVNLFEKLVSRGEDECLGLLASCWVGMNEEVKAIRLISHALLSSNSIPNSPTLSTSNNTPVHYTLLHTQLNHLLTHNKPEWALEVAKAAVNLAPSEFITWAKLTEVYVELGQFESALLTLNSCPMFTVNERDLHRMPTPGRTSLPVRPWIEDSGILDEGASGDETDVALLRLPAPSLKGTFAHAYSILAKLVSHIGWDELLKSRSQVFVMEEEYRMVKARADMKSAGIDPETPHGTPNQEERGREEEADDRASTIGMVEPSSSSHADVDGETTLAGTEEDQADAPLSPGIPMIKVSSESDREKELAEMREEAEAKAKAQVNGITDANGGHAPTLEKPVQAAVPVEGEREQMEKKGVAENGVEDPDHDDGSFSFANKRLCERWLDNLFMCLYEDLRIWTIFRAEVAHFKTQHLAYRKNSSEWEILGELGLRLHHKEEAKDAFQRCLDGKFSAKAWLRLLEMYAEEGDLQRALNAAIRLTVYNQRWYMETSYPTAVATHIYRLGQVHGHAKVSYTLLSMGLPEPIQKAMEGYLRYGRVFKVEGFDF